MKKILLVILFLLILSLSACNSKNSISYIDLEEIDVDFIDVVDSGSGMIALTESGHLFAWGNTFLDLNSKGYFLETDLAKDITGYLNLSEDEVIIKLIGGNEVYGVITNLNNLYIWGFIPSSSQIIFDQPTNIISEFTLDSDDYIIDMHFGSMFTLALSNNGDVFSIGANHYGQLGAGDIGSKANVYVNITNNFNLLDGEKITKISAGTEHSMALTNTNRIFVWGSNLEHQLGVDEIEFSSLPIDITANFTIEENDLFKQIEAGGNFNTILSNDGNVYTWGSNFNKSLGCIENLAYSVNPILITENFNLLENEYIEYISNGAERTIAYTNFGNIYIWGSLFNDSSLFDGATHFKTPENITSNFHLLTNENIIMISTYRNEMFLITTLGRQIGYSIEYNNIIEIKIFTENTIKVQNYNEGDTISSTETPVKSGYIFVGWYFDTMFSRPFNSNEYNVETMGASSFKVYAKWETE